MKNTFRLLFALVVLAAVSCVNRQEKQARNVIERTFGEMPENVEFHFTESVDSNKFYSLEVTGGKLRISGNSTVALCKGFHDYIQDNGYGCCTWSGSRMDIPEQLPEAELQTVTSPYDMHLFYNVCTFGYSTAYWGWPEWEKELDLLALHGYDMPLAPIATEAILWRVYSKMGLSDEEISAYFTGPGHFPWMRMGNMCSMDGGMSPEWHKSQIALQHKILDRMKELGMKPVFQGFAGFVPEAIEKHFPEVTLTRADWHGLHNQLLNATDSLFQTIGTAFIKEWEAEFGKGEYYLVDSFNEMDIPFGERGTKERYETIKGYAAATYQSIRNANPDAVWVMQGWMFGRDRKRIWDPESVKALLDGAPDDKLIIVDLAVDFNEFVWCSEKDWDYLDGFSGKRWIWSTTPNFGGRTSLKGVYDFYLNAHLDALASPNKGRLRGYGCSPEGIETNEPLYEAISAAGWSGERLDAREFLTQYLASRYGCAKDDVYGFADGLLGSVYDNFTNMDNFCWVSRPGILKENVFNINEGFYDGIETLLDLSDKCRGNKLYEYDVLHFTAMALAAKADELYREILILIVKGDLEKAGELENKLTDMLYGADRLLESHPLMRMQRWLDMADRMATNAAEKDEFRGEALRLVTTWDAPDIRDYASRLWSGLIRDYYIPRLKAFFNAAHNAEDFDIYELENRFIAKAAAEGLSPVTAYDDPIDAAEELFEEYVEDNDVEPYADVAGVYLPYTVKGGRIVVYLDKEQMEGLKGFDFCDIKGGPVIIKSVRVGNIRTNHKDGGPALILSTGGRYMYDGADSRVEKQTPFVFMVETGGNASGIIKLRK